MKTKSATTRNQDASDCPEWEVQLVKGAMATVEQAMVTRHDDEVAVAYFAGMIIGILQVIFPDDEDSYMQNPDFWIASGFIEERLKTIGREKLLEAVVAYQSSGTMSRHIWH